jgi:hypothetical protein
MRKLLSTAMATMFVLTLWGVQVRADDVPDCCKQQQACCKDGKACCPQKGQVQR